MSGFITALLEAFQIGVVAYPKVEALYIDFKNYITNLFKAGMISAEEQNATHTYVDGLQALAEAGIISPAWRVDPDPAPTVTVTTTPPTSTGNPA